MKRIEDTAAFQGIEVLSNILYFSSKDIWIGSVGRRLIEIIVQMVLVYVSSIWLSGLITDAPTTVWLLAAVLTIFSVVGYAGSDAYLTLIYGPNYKQAEMRRSTTKDIKDAGDRTAGDPYTGFGRTNIWPTFAHYLSFMLSGIHDWLSVLIWGGVIGLLGWFSDLFIIDGFRASDEDVNLDDYSTLWGPNIWTQWVVHVLFAGTVMFVTLRDNMNKEYSTFKFVIVRALAVFLATNGLYFSQVHFGYGQATLLAASIPYPGIRFITSLLTEGNYDAKILEHILVHVGIPQIIGALAVYLVMSLSSMLYKKTRKDWW